MRTVHRVVSLFVVVVTLYLGITGTLIQATDLRTLFRHAPATDPDMMAIREDHDGPGDYAVIGPADFTAAALPAQFDYQAALPKLLSAARAALGEAPLSYAEIRMSADKPSAWVQSGRQLLRYDFTADQGQAAPIPRRERPPEPSIRNEIKGLHRMTSIGDWALWINPIVGIALGVFVFTGVVMYWQLLSARARIGRRDWFWSAGGWWRTLHRWGSIVAALFITVVALSGTWLAYESLIFGIYMEHHGPQPGRPPMRQSGITALTDEGLPAMLTTTLQAYASSLPGQSLKVLRLRIYGGMPQGVIVAGLGDGTQQMVFNAISGRRVSETEPGYPETGFPFGWQAHQIAKQIHRGDYIGLSGRWMDLSAGVTLIYLSVSGLVMYVDMWRRRRRSGRKALIWS